MRFRDVEKMLVIAGFQQVRRCNGSHTIFENGAKRIIVTEHHNGEIPPHIVKKIRKQMGS